MLIFLSAAAGAAMMLQDLHTEAHGMQVVRQIASVVSGVLKPRTGLRIMMHDASLYHSVYVTSHLETSVEQLCALQSSSTLQSKAVLQKHTNSKDPYSPISIFSLHKEALKRVPQAPFQKKSSVSV
jgi:hypothetical protein